MAVRGAAAVVARLMLLALIGCVLRAFAADATDAPGTAPEDFAFHAQVTFTDQQTDRFRSPYAGTNSLLAERNDETADIAIYLGKRLWPGAEIWINPEVDQGFGLDNTVGVAGFPSAEAYKVGKDQPYPRLPRFFIRDTVDLGGERQSVEPQATQLGGEQDADRLVITVGKFGVVDIFDNNQYAHDPRNDFLNWAIVDAGSFDYAADAWAFTLGAAAEWYQRSWVLRFGVFDLSNVPNSPDLEPAFHEFQLDGELEKDYQALGAPGKARLTAYFSRGRMGLLDQAIALGEATDTVPSVAAVRQYRSRPGVSLDLEQQLSPDLGAFLRTGKSAGNVEVYEFTDIDWTASGGVLLQGARWSRPSDSVGLAGDVNWISGEREAYLNAGGLGVLIGDGRLPHPGPEKILETFYSVSVTHYAHLTLDYQYITNPAYNRDRGPVSVYAVRVHAQF
jgi:high affinity Mn2+ porin